MEDVCSHQHSSRAAWLICAVVVEGLNQGERDSERAPVWKEEAEEAAPTVLKPCAAQQRGEKRASKRLQMIHMKEQHECVQ